MKFLAIIAFALLLANSGANVKKLAGSSNRFGYNIYLKTVSNESSPCISPHSIHSALSMTSLGALGETAQEMTSVLELSNFTGSTAHEAYKNLTRQMNSVSSIILRTANALFVNPEYPIKSDFINKVKTFYNASVSVLDFTGTAGPEKPVNDFVNKTTEGTIKEIVPKGSITDQTALVLVNALFLNASWMKPFKERNTAKRDFKKADGTTVQIDTLYDERVVNLKRNDNGIDVAELPFRGGRFSLFVLMPKNISEMPALENSLTDPQIESRLLKGLGPKNVRFSIPKANMSSEVQLNSGLKDLGMVQAFDGSVADFQGISDHGKPAISSVFHRAVMKLSETGTVAAAVTAVTIELTSLQLPPDEFFTVDRPFIALLRDTTANLNLFIAKFSA